MRKKLVGGVSVQCLIKYHVAKTNLFSATKWTNKQKINLLVEIPSASEGN